MELPDFHIPHAEKIEWMIETNGWALEPVPADAESEPPTPGYAYSIGFVPAGNYVAAYTCDADPAEVNDHDPSLPPETDQDVNLLPSDVAPVVVTAGQTTENVDFGVLPAP